MGVRFEAQKSLGGRERVQFLNQMSLLLQQPSLEVGSVYDVLRAACLEGRSERFKPGTTAMFSQEYRFGSEVLGLCLAPPDLRDFHTELFIDRNENEIYKLERYQQGHTSLFVPVTRNIWVEDQGTEVTRRQILQDFINFLA